MQVMQLQQITKINLGHLRPTLVINDKIVLYTIYMSIDWTQKRKKGSLKYMDERTACCGAC